jgi:hypothetical protein
MTDDPIKNIEDEKGQKDMGVMAARVYLGALEETEDLENSTVIAFNATAAFFAGMFRGNQTEEGGDN